MSFGIPLSSCDFFPLFQHVRLLRKFSGFPPVVKHLPLFFISGICKLLLPRIFFAISFVCSTATLEPFPELFVFGPYTPLRLSTGLSAAIPTNQPYFYLWLLRRRISPFSPIGLLWFPLSLSFPHLIKVPPSGCLPLGLLVLYLNYGLSCPLLHPPLTDRSSKFDVMVFFWMPCRPSISLAFAETRRRSTFFPFLAAPSTFGLCCRVFFRLSKPTFPVLLATSRSNLFSPRAPPLRDSPPFLT